MPQSLFADILSVLAMTYSDTQPRGTLRYHLLSASLLPPSSTLSDPGSWGHEYVRHLAAELGEEYMFRTVGETPESTDSSKDDAHAKDEKPPPAPATTGTVEDLRELAVQCARFLLSHNAKPDAVDLLEELEIVHKITELVDDDTYVQVCQYIIRQVLLIFCYV
jgi:26S proteasome regulatory subunit N1